MCETFGEFYSAEKVNFVNIQLKKVNCVVLVFSDNHRCDLTHINAVFRVLTDSRCACEIIAVLLAVVCFCFCNFNCSEHSATLP